MREQGDKEIRGVRGQSNKGIGGLGDKGTTRPQVILTCALVLPLSASSRLPMVPVYLPMFR